MQIPVPLGALARAFDSIQREKRVFRTYTIRLPRFILCTRNVCCVYVCVLLLRPGYREMKKTYKNFATVLYGWAGGNKRRGSGHFSPWIHRARARAARMNTNSMNVKTCLGKFARDRRCRFCRHPRPPPPPLYNIVGCCWSLFFFLANRINGQCASARGSFFIFC